MEPFGLLVLVGVPSLLWIAASAAVAFVAGRRGQSALVWFLIAVVATPFLAALLLLAITDPAEPRAPA